MPVYIRKQGKVRGWICPQRYSYRSNSHSRSSLTIDSTVFPSGKNSTTRPNAADGTAFNSCVPWKPQCVFKQCKKLFCLFFVDRLYVFQLHRCSVGLEKVSQDTAWGLPSYQETPHLWESLIPSSHCDRHMHCSELGKPLKGWSLGRPASSVAYPLTSLSLSPTLPHLFIYYLMHYKTPLNTDSQSIWRVHVSESWEAF